MSLAPPASSSLAPPASSSLAPPASSSLAPPASSSLAPPASSSLAPPVKALRADPPGLPAAGLRVERAVDLRQPAHTVVDLFSGAGGMSCGFARHPAFAIAGAADAQVGKPSSPAGALGCNASYARNVGVEPLAVDLAAITPEDLRDLLALPDRPVVLSACAPCTGFTRALARNHVVDDPRNSLVGRVGAFARVLRPEVIVMENARELLMGRFAAHFAALRAQLEALGYQVSAAIHVLSDFGLPQRRERALVVASRHEHPVRNLDDLWSGLAVRAEATHVRRAIGHLPPVEAGVAHPDDAMHVAPRNLSPVNRRRLAAIPGDGGSWTDLIEHPDAAELLAPSMRRRAALGDLGSHPDVYGRLWWDRPAATIKRECGHIGNGRYAHPEQDRLCTIREMANMQGFPSDYELVAPSLANRYRHVGDAVPPLVAYQVACLVSWILGADRPPAGELVLPGCSLTPQDVVEA
jgi:DNA (cytosine-5)-methyltransferase 1